MRKPNCYWIIATILSCLFSYRAFCQNKPVKKLPDINDIFPEFLNKFTADSFYIGENYTHEEQEINDDIKDGIVKRKDIKIYLVKKQNNGLYRKLILSDGEVPANSKFEIKKSLFNFDANFFGRYILTIERYDVLEGTECWVVLLKPRIGFPEKEIKDRVVNNLSGEIWIAKKTLLFKQLRVHLTKEVQFAMPGFAGGKVMKVDCVIKATTIEGRFAISYVWVDYQYSANVFFIPINSHKIKTINYENYERRTK